MRRKTRNRRGESDDGTERQMASHGMPAGLTPAEFGILGGRGLPGVRRYAQCLGFPQAEAFTALRTAAIGAPMTAGGPLISSWTAPQEHLSK